MKKAAARPAARGGASAAREYETAAQKMHLATNFLLRKRFPFKEMLAGKQAAAVEKVADEAYNEVGKKPGASVDFEALAAKAKVKSAALAYGFLKKVVSKLPAEGLLQQPSANVDVGSLAKDENWRDVKRKSELLEKARKLLGTKYESQQVMLGHLAQLAWLLPNLTRASSKEVCLAFERISMFRLPDSDEVLPQASAFLQFLVHNRWQLFSNPSYLMCSDCDIARHQLRRELHLNCLLEGCALPRFVRDAVDYLMDHGTAKKGLFRVSGNAATIDEILENYDRGNVTFRIAESEDDQYPHAVAGALKKYLREYLPHPLVSYSLLADHKGEWNKESVKQVIEKMHRTHQAVLRHILKLLRAVAQKAKGNQMNAANLEICTKPSFVSDEPLPTNPAEVIKAKSLPSRGFLEALINETTILS